MADPLARNDWIGTREDRWTDILPQSWQSAINTNPMVNALARYMQPRQTFDQAAREWQDNIPGNSPIDRIAEGRSTIAKEFPSPMSPLAAEAFEKGGFLANFLSRGGVKLPPQGANNGQVLAQRIQNNPVSSKVEVAPGGFLDMPFGGGGRLEKIGNSGVFYDRTGPARVYIESLETQGAGGQGNARRLMEKMIERADREGVTLVLEASPQNAQTDGARLKRFYESIGFEKSGGIGGNEMRRSPRSLNTEGGGGGSPPVQTEILRKYGILPPIAAGGAAAADQLINGDGGSGPAIAGRPGLGAMIPKAMRPQIMRAPEGGGGGGPTQPGIKAYHGSPHDFDKFDISKIGTGEGAQAYGRGLYFAESEGVAKNYRDQLSPVRIEYDGGPFQSSSGTYAKIHDPGPSGRMYEVRINADPEKFLDWDKPLSQQSEAVRRAVQNLPQADVLTRKNGASTVTPLMDREGDAFYSALAEKLGTPFDPKFPRRQEVLDHAKASQALREAGIPGIRYKDAMSRGTEAGTSNYVVFDAALIEILRKYGLLPPMAAGGALMGGSSEAGASPAP